MAKKEETDLDAMVEDVDPDTVNEKVEIKHREARNAFKLEKIKVDTYSQFKKKITEYEQHHHKKVYGTEMPEELAFSKAMAILNEVYKKEGGFVGAFKEAKKGNMNSVLDALANFEEGEHRSAYVQHVMSRIDPMDFDAHVKLVDKYKAKYDKFLPKEMKKKSSAELAKNYQELIQHHANVVDSVRSKLKKYEPKEEKEAA